MFRRKEESNDPSNPAASAPVSHTGGNSTYAAESGAASAPASAPAQPVSASSQPAASASNSTYVPSASGNTGRTSEPARPATPTTGSSYRPTPIAEFNRGAARGPADSLRSSAPGSAPSGFSVAGGEKSASGKSNRRVLTVGNDILLKGEIATCDRLVIEGRVEAKLSEVHTVEIAECGSFKGTAEVEDAEISGIFEGDLIVRNRLVIYTTGEVRGNISYGEIEIERGGRLTGQIKTAAAASAKGKAFDDKRTTGKETTAAA